MKLKFLPNSVVVFVLVSACGSTEFSSQNSMKFGDSDIEIKSTECAENPTASIDVSDINYQIRAPQNSQFRLYRSISGAIMVEYALKNCTISIFSDVLPMASYLTTSEEHLVLSNSKYDSVVGPKIADFLANCYAVPHYRPLILPLEEANKVAADQFASPVPVCEALLSQVSLNLIFEDPIDERLIGGAFILDGTTTFWNNQ